MFVVLRVNVSATVWYRFRLGLGLCRFPCSWLRFWGLVTGLLRLWSPFCVWGTFRRVFFWWKCKLRSIRPPCISNWAAVRLGNGNGRNMLRQIIRIESTWDFIWYNFQHEHVSGIFRLDTQTYENDSIIKTLDRSWGLSSHSFLGWVCFTIRVFLLLHFGLPYFTLPPPFLWLRSCGFATSGRWGCLTGSSTHGTPPKKWLES